MAIAMAAGACASAPRSSFAARFIIPGTPAVDLTAPGGGGPAIATADGWSPPAPTSAPVPSAPAASPPAIVVASTLEATSPLLRARLAALAASPSAEAHLEVAAAYQSYDIHDRAFDYLAEGLAHFPAHAGLHEAMARLWRDWGFADRALRHAHLAVRYAPASASAATTLGSVLWALDARDAALSQFTRARRLDPDAAWARANWCTAMLGLGRPRPFTCDPPFPAGAAAATPRP